MIEGSPARAGWAAQIARWSAFLTVTGRSSVTVRKYRRTLVNFLADTLLELDAVTEDDVVGYLARLDPRGAMRGDTLRALRSYYRWAETHELVASPVQRLTPKAPRSSEPPVLDDEQLMRLVLALAWREPRRAWTALLLYGTGARIAAACALTREDVWAGRLHFRRDVKGGYPYSVPLVGVAKTAVEELELLEHARLIGVCPTRVRQWLDQAGHDSGVRAWPHLFRHTFATRLARVTDLRTWMELMNHRDPSQFRLYAHANEDDVRSAMEAATGHGTLTGASSGA